MLWSSARVGRASPGGPVNSLTADELARGDNTPVVALTMREGRWYGRYREEETFDAGAMAVRRRRGGVRRRRLSVVPSRLPARPYPRALGGRATAIRSPRQARLTEMARPGVVAPCGEPVDGPARSTLRRIRNGSGETPAQALWMKSSCTHSGVVPRAASVGMNVSRRHIMSSR
jgi:hypothetical protein